jgi:transposase
MYDIGFRNAALRVYFHSGMSLRKTAKCLELSPSTLHRWKESDGKNKQYSQRERTVVVQVMLDFFRCLLNTKPCVTVHQLRQSYYDYFQRQVSRYAVLTALRLLKVTRKRCKIRGCTEKQGTAEHDQLINNFKATYNNSVAHNNLMESIDESGFEDCTARWNYGYSVAGKSVVSKYPVRKDSRARVNMILSIRNDGSYDFSLYANSTVNSQKFSDHIQSCSATDSLLLLDNISFHKSKIVSLNRKE